MIQLAKQKLNVFKNLIQTFFEQNITLCEEDKGFYLNPFKAHFQCNIFHINRIKWGPDQCFASYFALNS